MALTYNAALHKTSIGSNWLLVTTVTPASSDYPTAGYLLDTTFGKQLPVGNVKSVLYGGTNNTAKTTAYSVQYNQSTGKLQVFQSAGSAAALAEVANGTDLSALTFVLIVIGK